VSTIIVITPTELGVIALCGFWLHLHLQARDISEKLKVTHISKCYVQRIGTWGVLNNGVTNSGAAFRSSVKLS
jgi:hypothetical protein